MTGPKEITSLLEQWRCHDQRAGDRLFRLLMPDLRRIAARCLRSERHGHTLQPTALINEVFLRLARSNDIEWRDRGHFLSLAARVMRHHLIDYARSRPEAQFTPLKSLPRDTLNNHTQLELAVAIDALLEELGRESHQQRAIVELKFFLGLTDAEAADALSVPVRTLQREWHRARRWLFERLSARA